MSDEEDDGDDQSCEDYDETDDDGGDNDDDESSESDEETRHYRCPCHFHANHWSDRINNQRIRLRELVQERLTSIFKITPSLRLYNSILAVSPELDDTAPEIMDILSSIASSSSETFAAALDIHAAECNTEDIASLLDSHSHLLRPRDAPTFQSAVAVLSDDPFFQLRSLKILEKELIETARTIRAALLCCFSHIDDDIHRAEMAQIVNLRHGSSTRQDRIERWVDAVITPGTNPPHPMVFAAMMMGLPVGPVLDDTEDADALGYLDFDHTDPDLEDLREEFRPRLKERFEGWNETAMSMKGGPGVLLKVYAKLLELMPYMRASDAVDEMIGRYNSYVPQSP